MGGNFLFCVASDFRSVFMLLLIDMIENLALTLRVVHATFLHKEAVLRGRVAHLEALAGLGCAASAASQEPEAGMMNMHRAQFGILKLCASEVSEILCSTWAA